VTVSASATSVTPGGTISFRVSAWDASQQAATITTTLAPSAKTPAFSPPVVTFAGGTGQPGSTNYNLTLPVKQPAAPQIDAQVSVPKTAPAGETIQFSATVSVASGGGSPLTASASAPTVTVAKTSASPSPSSRAKSGAGGSAGSSSGSSSRGSAATVPSLPGTTSSLGADVPVAALPVGALPVGALPVAGSGTTGGTVNVPAGSAASLFPEISPSSAPSPAPKTAPGTSQGQNAVATSSVIPISLTSSEFESQIIGLIVLLLGVATVITGISMRKIRATGTPSTEGRA
jgi:hypothetical protein